MLIYTFTSYGTEHASWLILGMISIIGAIWFGRRQKSEASKQKIGLAIAMVPVVIWSLVSLYLVITERPIPLSLVLPFHVCYAINLLMPIMLWRRSYALFEVCYFIVMAGCIQALFTPDMQTTFPDYINIRYFVTHIGLVQSILYAIFVFKFRPTWRGLLKAFLWTNVYFVFVMGINTLLGTNFMFLKAKPPSPNILDFFGEWPWYILGAECLALVLFVVVMLPFAWRNKGGGNRPTP